MKMKGNKYLSSPYTELIRGSLNRTGHPKRDHDQDRQDQESDSQFLPCHMQVFLGNEKSPRRRTSNLGERNTHQLPASDTLEDQTPLFPSSQQFTAQATEIGFM